MMLLLFGSSQIEIDIEPTDKVERIKERVEEKEGIPPPQQRLIFSGKQMWAADMSLHHVPGHGVCVLNIVVLWPSLNILYCMLNSLYSDIYANYNFPRNDEKTAADYKVQGGSVLHLVLALRGGAISINIL